MKTMPAQYYTRRITELRKRFGITQVLLGHACSCSHNSWTKFEADTRKFVDYRKIWAAADVFQCTMGYILGIEDKPWTVGCVLAWPPVDE